MTLRHKMSSVDTAWLRMDRPSNLMMIVGVLMFEGRVDYDRLKATIVARIAPFNRFRQTVDVDESGAWWVDLPPSRDALDFDYHLQRAQLPGNAGKEALQAYAATRITEPLDPSRPLWQMTLLDNYEGGSALVIRIHHCIADGIALVGVMLKLTDRSPHADDERARDDAAAESSASELAIAGSVDDESEAPTPESTNDESDFWKQLIAPMTAAAIRTIDASGAAVSKSLEMIAQPEKATHYAKIAGAVAAEVARLVAMPDDSSTRFKGKPGQAKMVAWSEPMPLDVVKAAGRVLDGSVNDVLLSCVAGALRAYLIDNGDDPDGVEIRAMIPVNLRPAQPATADESQASSRSSTAGALGNRFGLVTLSLPLGIANPIARLVEVRARMDALKGSYQAPVTLGVLGLVGMAPKVVQTQVLDLLAKKATAVMTNVPGPQLPLYMAGARLDQMMFWVPQSGDIGMGVSILSYNGGVQLGLVTDGGLVPDPARIVERFEPEFDRLLLAVLMCPRDVDSIDATAAESAIFGTSADSGADPTSAGRKTKAASRQRRARHPVTASL